MTTTHSVQVPTQTSVAAPETSLAQPTQRSGLLHPVGMADLTQRQLYREFLRWPTLLWAPATVAILTIIGMHSYVAAVPTALVLATAATLNAVHRACARIPHYEIAAVTGLIPFQRSGDLR